MSINFFLKRALVTGAGKGIGRGIALKLANLGAKVHAISRTDSDLDSLKKECAEIEVYNVDIAKWETTTTLVKAIGPIDFLVNNAAIAFRLPFLDVSKNEIDNLFDVNFKAAINISQIVAKDMIRRKDGGSIVNISSTVSCRVVNGAAIYCASKAALDMLTKSMAAELGPHNIRVNSVNPGLVVTPLLLSSGYGSEETLQYIRTRTPLPRMVEINDIVNATVFLLSDQAAMINGINLTLDGGMMNNM